MKSTSREAFESILPTLGDRQRVVFEFLMDCGPACNLEISEALSLPINTVTPRVLELRKMNLVVEDREDEGPTGKRSKFWRAVEDPINFNPKFKNPGSAVFGSVGSETGGFSSLSPDSFRIQHDLFKGAA